MAQLFQLVDDVVTNRFNVGHRGLSLGRHRASDIQIDDAAVSARHARIRVEPNKHFPRFHEYYLEDLDSTNGTFVNDRRITGSHRLRHNDRVRIAWNQFKFTDTEEAQLEETLHMLSSSRA